MNKQYAIAFFEIAKEDNTLNECKESFDVFLEVLKQENDLALVLNSPKIKTNEKKDLINNAFSKCSEDFIYFINVVLDNGRIDKINEIYQEFERLYNEENKVKIVEVRSAQVLSEQEKTRLLNSLKKCYAGYEIVLCNKVEPNVVGGYHILVNGLSIDLSIKRKIENLENHLIN